MHNINKIAAETLDNINIHQEAQDYEWRGDQDYTPNEKERALLEDFGNGLLATVNDLIRSALSAQVQDAAGIDDKMSDLAIEAFRKGFTRSSFSQTAEWAFDEVTAAAPAAKHGDAESQDRYGKVFDGWKEDWK